MPNENALLIVFATFYLVLLIGLVTIAKSCYKRCRSNHVLVRTGLGGLQVSRQAMLVFLVLHTYGVLSLEPLQIEIPAASIGELEIDSD